MRSDRNRLGSPRILGHPDWRGGRGCGRERPARRGTLGRWPEPAVLDTARAAGGRDRRGVRAVVRQCLAVTVAGRCALLRCRARQSARHRAQRIRAGQREEEQHERSTHQPQDSIRHVVIILIGCRGCLDCTCVPVPRRRRVAACSGQAFNAPPGTNRPDARPPRRGPTPALDLRRVRPPGPDRSSPAAATPGCRRAPTRCPRSTPRDDRPPR